METDEKKYPNGLIFILGKIAWDVDTQMNYKEKAEELEKKGYHAIFVLSNIERCMSKFLRYRYMIYLMMQCNSIYIMEGYNETTIGRIMFKLALELDYNINLMDEQTVKSIHGVLNSH